VKALSGGASENRLLLARLFTRPANVLVLDEPTTNLDLETLGFWKRQLVEWPGTLPARVARTGVSGQVVTSTFVFRRRWSAFRNTSEVMRTGCDSESRKF